jgi:hypothetical protein
MPWPVIAVFAFVLLACTAPRPSWAFPPYRSTDADTADPWVFEARLGLLRVQRERSETAYSSPLWRGNLGLPHKTEIVTEFEFRADEAEAADAAIGLKWVPLFGAFSLGIETLALLPVAPDTRNAGVESQLVTTVRSGELLLHLNGGGFYDARPAEPEAGWRSSVLAELQVGRRFRPGFEVFGKQVEDAPVQVSAGPGVIADAGLAELRVGLEAGITDEAPDLRFNVWIARKFPLH